MAKVKKREISIEELLVQALVPEDEQPYGVPENWVWTRMGTVAKWGSGGTPSRSKPEYYIGEIPWVKTGELDNGFIYDTEEKISEDALRNSSAKLFPAKSILIAMYGATIGKVGILGVEATSNQACACGVSNLALHYKYLFYYALSQGDNFIKKGKGGAQPNISQEIIKAHLFPLSPLAEQQRIVKRIESLFAKLDQAKELAQNAVDTFETRKAAILHKAFIGELTAQWREVHYTDATDGRLISIIEKRKEVGDISRELALYIDGLNIDDVTDSKGWLHLKAMLLCGNITCGGTPTGYLFNRGEIPFLKVYNIVDNKISFAEKPQFTNREIQEGKLKSSKLKPNDVVMNIVGPPLRKIAIIPNDYDEWNMNQAIVRFRTLDYVLPKYLYYCLIYPSTLNEVISETKGVVGQANISITQSRNLNIPVPSLSEQQEIVRILDRFIEKEQRANELADVIDKIVLMKKAILARAFRGELGTNDLSEESAVELLKEALTVQ